MQGTLLCGVTDTEEGLDAAPMAAELSKRLGLRLVLAHVEDGFEPIGEEGDSTESVSMRGSRERAARVVARLAAESGADDAVQRAAVGDPARSSAGWPQRRLPTSLSYARGPAAGFAGGSRPASLTGSRLRRRYRS